MGGDNDDVRGRERGESVREEESKRERGEEVKPARMRPFVCQYTSRVCQRGHAANM